MQNRMGRPPKYTENKMSSITIRVDGATKNLILELADGYDMTITEYLLTLISRDAAQSPESP